jgi:3-hydroxymyristoyl/3-hydroxydecanoyl-(acyl carrier protein) dehydratase
MPDRLSSSIQLMFPSDHPAFAGHFPGMPIVPGVLLLDEVVFLLVGDCSAWSVSSIKFLSAVAPGEVLDLLHGVTATGSIHFDLVCGARKVASGSLARDPS